MVEINNNVSMKNSNKEMKLKKQTQKLDFII